MNRTPLIFGIVLLLLPVLYVGSYFAMVVPRPSIGKMVQLGHGPLWKYRCGDRFAVTLFWPLEQIDRRIRPDAWEPKFRQYSPYIKQEPIEAEP